MKPLSLISAISVYSLYTKTGATLQRNPLSCDNAVFRKEPRVMKTVSVLSQPPNDTKGHNPTSADVLHRVFVVE